MKKILYVITIFLILGNYQNICAQTNNIKITYVRNPDKSIDFSFTKELPGSYFIKLEFPTLENCYQSTVKKVVENSSGNLIKLRPINDQNHIVFSYKYSSIRGKPNPKIDKDFNYVLPFKVGETVKIIEAISLKEKYFNAEKSTNWKSFIVDRNSADTICNMRKGIVIEIINKFETDSLDMYRYTSSMNKILVEHSDGTVAYYTGFNKNSIFVKLGQTVYPNTKLGTLSIFNNAIYRLYFSVSYLKDASLNTGEERTLKSDSRLEHVNPYFYSSNGPILLQHSNEYLVEMDENTRFKEFTKRERKKFKKDAQAFY